MCVYVFITVIRQGGTQRFTELAVTEAVKLLQLVGASCLINRAVMLCHAKTANTGYSEAHRTSPSQTGQAGRVRMTVYGRWKKGLHVNPLIQGFYDTCIIPFTQEKYLQ